MVSTCEKCPLKRYAEKKPNAIISRIWKWHTGWCPGWKAYQKSLQEGDLDRTSFASLLKSSTLGRGDNDFPRQKIGPIHAPSRTKKLGELWRSDCFVHLCTFRPW